MLYLVLLIGLPSIALHIVYYNVRYLSIDDIADNVLNFLDRKAYTRPSDNRGYYHSATHYSTRVYSISGKKLEEEFESCGYGKRDVDKRITIFEAVKHYPKELRKYFISHL